MPEFRISIGSHFYHKYEFLLRAQKDCDLFVILEKGERPEHIAHAYIQRFHFFPFSTIELFCALAWLRIRGYKTFWTHYSFAGAILAPFFGRSFYWNCGMPWLYMRGWFEECIFRLALRRSMLVTGTKRMKNMYVREYRLSENRVWVLPNWISIDRFYAWAGRKKEARDLLGFPEHARIILFLHHLSKRKGADMIAPVASYFTNDADILFVVAGAGPLQNSIKGSNIRYVGEVANEDVPIYFAAADIFFMPSEEEGFPHVLLEAMAVGVPIVASDVGGVREIVSSGVQKFITEQDVQEFQKNITLLLNNSELRKILAREEMTWVQRYTIEKVKEQFIALISEKI